MEKTINVFIVGSKGIPSNYGGYETFVDNLVTLQRNYKIKYHVACMNQDVEEKEYNGARCFNVKVPDIGSAKAIYYDIEAIRKSIQYIKENKIEKPIIYVLACRIGPFIRNLKKQIIKLGGKLYVNPDGHEWLRSKWSAPVRKYWKLSEKLMVKYADLLICDSLNIEKYIKEAYQKYSPNTTFIAYGAELLRSTLSNDDQKLNDWYKEKKIQAHKYYLIVGRFVPENNYKTMIEEFMKSNTEKDLVIVTNIEENNFFKNLRKETEFEKDKRIKFVGTVYHKELIKKIRENAYGYIHGHSVGGTNPSLIEALASTDLNLLYDVGFNREVGLDSALYWTLEDKSLSNLIEKCDKFDNGKIQEYAKLSSERVKKAYTWKKIINDYENVFLKEHGEQL